MALIPPPLLNQIIIIGIIAITLMKSVVSTFIMSGRVKVSSRQDAIISDFQYSKRVLPWQLLDESEVWKEDHEKLSKLVWRLLSAQLHVSAAPSQGQARQARQCPEVKAQQGQHFKRKQKVMKEDFIWFSM